MSFNSEISKKLSHQFKSGKEFLFVVDFNCSDILIFTPEEARLSGIYYDFEGKTNFNYSDSKPSLKKFNYKAIDFNHYLKEFNIVKAALQRGDTYLINLTCRTELVTDYSLMEIFSFRDAKFKLLFKNDFVVFSPERFVRISNGRIETNPMKGTIDALLPNAENILKSDKKELFEHNTIVDLLRNDLNLVANNVTVENFRYVDKLTTSNGELLQISSKISGDLRPGYNENMGDIICSLLPAGSVTGAPKTKTVEIIKQAEDYNRGFYTGVFGFFDGAVLDVAVAIRFIESENGKLWYKSGGGITALSKPEEEYNEMLKKIYVPIF